jgi:hypothetical protein
MLKPLLKRLEKPNEAIHVSFIKCSTVGNEEQTTLNNGSIDYSHLSLFNSTIEHEKVRVYEEGVVDYGESEWVLVPQKTLTSML